MTHYPHPFKMREEGRLISIDIIKEVKLTKSYWADIEPKKFLECKAIYKYKSKNGKAKGGECVLWVKWL